jgi:3',5'-cyclic AMP phosphodiesterase CpdA
MTRALRIAVLSDLHLDLRLRHLVRDGMPEAEARAALGRLAAGACAPVGDADLVVLAGDVADGVAGIAWAAETFAGRPVAYVAGNHEFYRHRYEELLPRLRTAARSTPNVTFLENEEARFEIAGRSLRLAGCVLWSDYALYGEEAAAVAREQAAARILDHKRIEVEGGVLMQPAHAERWHLESRRFLERALASPFGGTTVVVTHHAPSPRSVAPQFHGDPLSPAFASDLTELVVRFAPPLWVHGHTHHPVDHLIGGTRVLSNPWGYPTEDLPLTTAVVDL